MWHGYHQEWMGTSRWPQGKAIKVRIEPAAAANLVQENDVDKVWRQFDEWEARLMGLVTFQRVTAKEQADVPGNGDYNYGIRWRRYGLIESRNITLPHARLGNMKPLIRSRIGYVLGIHTPPSQALTAVEEKMLRLIYSMPAGTGPL